MFGMKPSDLQPGALIKTLWAEFRIVNIQTHPRFGLEFQVIRGRQKPLWYSERMVASWLGAAETVDNPLPSNVASQKDGSPGEYVEA